MLIPSLAGVGLGGNGGIYIGRNTQCHQTAREIPPEKKTPKQLHVEERKKKEEANGAETAPRERCCTLPKRRGG